MSSAYQPQTGGLTERAIQTVEQMLRGVVNAGHTDWDKHLDMVGFAYHNSSQASNGHSPFYLHYGEQPYTPIQMALDSHAATKVPWTLDFLSKLQAAVERGSLITLAAQERQKRNADQHRREEKLYVGEKVWLSTEHMRMSEGQAGKLSKRWIGPNPIKVLFHLLRTD